MTFNHRVSPFAVWSFAIVCTLLGCQSAPPLDVAPNVDLSRFQGKWYEIARLPRTTEADCHGTTQVYTQHSDGSLSLLNQCNVGSATGPSRTVSMKATVPDGTEPAKLALDVGGFKGDYWILEIGPDYDYAVVGHPSRQYLWILSRTPTLDADVMNGVLARAQSRQFDTAALEYTPQPPASESASTTATAAQNGSATSPTFGCTVPSAPRGDRGVAWCVGAVLAFVVARRGRSGGGRRRARANDFRLDE